MTIISWLLSLLTGHDGPRPAHHFDFLALPAEVRNKIYSFTLTTDPSRLDREHEYDCEWCTWKPDEPQNPVFHGDDQKLPGCRCWARKGLALLLANRQIHEEAAPIFWSENDFSFRDVASFTRLVSRTLRLQYHPMIRHVTIYSDQYPSADIDHIDFRDKLFECNASGLHTLQTPACHVFTPAWTEADILNTQFAAWLRLTSELPNLETFSWVELRSVWDRRPSRLCVDGLAYPCRLSRCLDLAVLSPEQFRTYGPFNSDWGEELVEKICRDAFPGFPRGPRHPVEGGVLVSTGRPHEYRCTAGMTVPTVNGEDASEVAHQEVIPMTWTLKICLLPLSPETIAQNSMRRARDENLKKTQRRGPLGLGALNSLVSLVKERICQG